MFGVIPKMMWQRVVPADENNLCNWAIRSLLVDTGNRVILFDNGYGDKQGERFLKYVYLNGGEGLEGGLERLGYRPEDITDMVLTHLHADHCGGGVKRGASEGEYQLAFPNATYHVSRKQWEWATTPNIRESASYPQENILPMMESGQLNLIYEPGELCKGVDLRMASGHTPGMLYPVIDYNGSKVVFGADLIPTTAHIPLLWNMSYEIDPLLTIEEKSDLLEEAVAGNYLLVLQHDIEAECATLVKTEKGVRAGERLSLEEGVARLGSD